MRASARVVAVVLVWLGSGAASAGEVDAAKWAQLRVGMAETEVLRLLGEPVRREQPAANRTTLTYGEIVPKGQIFPKGLAYIVWLDENKKLDSMDTPFGSAAPRAGAPGNPRVFLPLQNSVYDHYPRLIDVRWYAVAGSYPMKYEVAYEYGYTESPKGGGAATLTWRLRETFNTDLPYLSLQHIAYGPGRVRVRGLNVRGAGPWSDYTLFEFKR